MTLQQQVPSLELCNRLKELGYPQESYFYWSKAMDKKTWVVENRQFFAIDKRRDVSAPTVAELGEVMKDVDIAMPKFWGGYWEYENNLEKFVLSDTESDSRAKMLIYLLENKLITL